MIYQITKWFKTINIKVLLAFMAVYLIWGTTYLAIKIGLEHIQPFIMASLRFLIAGFLLLSFCLVKRETIFSKEAFRQMLLGAFMLTFGQAILFWAEQYITSGMTAVFSATLPICYLLTDSRNRKNYFSSNLTLFSLFLGLFGILILFSGQLNIGSQQTNIRSVIASLTVLGSCFCWAAGSLFYKYQPTEGSLFCNVGWQLIGGTISCSFISLIKGELQNFRFSEVPLSCYGVICYLAVAGSIIALCASYYLLNVRPAAIVGTYAYVNPIIAVLLGYLFAGEVLTISQVIGISIILIAAYSANKVKFNI